MDLRREARRSLGRLLPRLERRWARLAADRSDRADAWRRLERRLRANFEPLFGHLHRLYGDRYDFFYHLEEVLAAALAGHLEREASLLELDRRRRERPSWFLDHRQLGAVCYVDLFAGDLEGLERRIPYLERLGVTFLHLMPLFTVPEGENDGGYAVSDYRRVDPRLGTMAQLRRLGRRLRERGICLALDFVFNHTSDAHAWARAARAGDETCRGYYWLFEDRTLPDRYQEHLRDIFPDRRGGSFSWCEEAGAWVWTTFNSYQWDLNYQNPELFTAMLGELLALANAGAEVLRMDAVAFIWKRMGTDCENQPEAHSVLRAYSRLLRVVAPAVQFLSEAIVHPDQVASYISPEECRLSYNPLLMALLWNSLATRKVRLLRHSTGRRLALPEGCGWVNYVRCHDDIGWTFSDEDAGELGINGRDHRAFLNAFYTGRFSGSFAQGLPFGENPRTGDCRISGTTASLCGLRSRAGRGGDDPEAELAVRRVLLMHGVILSIGGLPLIYLGDEVAQLNDTGYTARPDRAADSRWVHRPRRSWEREAQLMADPTSPASRVRAGLDHLLHLRRSTPALGRGRTRVLPLAHDHVLAYERLGGDGERLLVLANFSDSPQRVPLAPLDLRLDSGQGPPLVDLILGRAVPVSAEAALDMAPYQLCWLRRPCTPGDSLQPSGLAGPDVDLGAAMNSR